MVSSDQVKAQVASFDRRFASNDSIPHLRSVPENQ